MTPHGKELTREQKEIMVPIFFKNCAQISSSAIIKENAKCIPKSVIEYYSYYHTSVCRRKNDNPQQE